MYDDLKSFKVPTEAILKTRTADIKKVSPEEIKSNINIILKTLADHHVKVTDIQAGHQLRTFRRHWEWDSHDQPE